VLSHAGRRDSDDTATHIDERSAGEARVEREIDGEQLTGCRSPPGPDVQRADDAGAGPRSHAERQHEVADAQVVVIRDVGDGHAAQGDGEVDITAIETSLIGTFQFIVRKDMHLKWPRAETPTHFMTMGFNDDLNACATMAVREMIDFLVTEKHLTRDDAYMLASVAADLHITELVDGNKGVHMMLPKSIFVSGSPK